MITGHRGRAGACESGITVHNSSMLPRPAPSGHNEETMSQNLIKTPFLQTKLFEETFILDFKSPNVTHTHTHHSAMQIYFHVFYAKIFTIKYAP